MRAGQQRSIRLPLIAAVAAVLALYATAAGGLPALAHGGATGIVKERMEHMKAIGAAAKRLAAMFAGQAEYDAAAVREAAAAIRSHGGEALTTLFPEGSLQAPTEALPAIWQDWARFEALADELALYAETLEAAADNPAGPMAGGMMGPRAGTMMGRAQAAGGPPCATATGPEACPQGGSMRDPEALKQMPPQASFMRLRRTCQSCHDAFREEKK